MSYTNPQYTGTMEPGHQQSGMPYLNQNQLSSQLGTQPTNIAAPTPVYQSATAEKQMHASQNQAQYPPQAQQPASTQQRNVYPYSTPLGSLQQQPAPIDCPFCGNREMSRVEYHSGTTTHLSALLCCFCFCLGCVPYLATWFKDAQHNCGACGRPVAIWHKSGRTEVLGNQRN